MILQTGVGIAVACWALARTWTNTDGGPLVYLADFVACLVLAWFIIKGLCA